MYGNRFIALNRNPYKAIVESPHRSAALVENWLFSVHLAPCLHPTLLMIWNAESSKTQPFIPSLASALTTLSSATAYYLIVGQCRSQISSSLQCWFTPPRLAYVLYSAWLCVCSSCVVTLTLLLPTVLFYSLFDLPNLTANFSFLLEYLHCVSGAVYYPVAFF